jgi:PAS domain S-box-containing protein
MFEKPTYEELQKKVQALERVQLESEHAEEAPKSSFSLLRAALESTADGLLIVSKEGKVTKFNQKFAEMWNIPKDIIDNDNDDLLLNHAMTQLADPGQFLSKVNKIYATPEELSYDQIELIDGRTFERYSQPQKIGNSVVGRVWSFRDITSRKRAEETLRESEEAFRSLFEDHAAVKLIIDPDTGAIVAANHAAAAFYGWSRETLAQMNIQQINTKPPDEIKERMKDAKDRKRIHFEFQHRLADGSIRDVEVFSSKVAMHGHGYLHSIIHDITDRKQAEAAKAELQAQNRQLQKAESLSRMAGAIAHHFNNQLAAVMGNLELAIEDLPQSGTPVKNLIEATKAAQKAAEVSGLMLTYLGQTTAKKEPMDMGEVCRQSLPLLRATLPETILLETDFPSSARTINGNANQIQQLLTNIVTNAGESIVDSRGSIHLNIKTVSAENIPRLHRYPMDWQPQDIAYACLEVADSGCGIAEKDIEKLFDPFFTSKFTGRGLGLPVVLGIVRTHRGVITVESQPGRGSIFRVFFPEKPYRND